MGLPAVAEGIGEIRQMDKHREVNSKFRAERGMGESDGGGPACQRVLMRLSVPANSMRCAIILMEKAAQSGESLRERSRRMACRGQEGAT